MSVEPSCTTSGIASGRPPRSRRSGRLSRLGDTGDLTQVLDQFCRRYSNPKTADDYRRTLSALFRFAAVRHPAELTEADLLVWCPSGAVANNTVYNRATKASTFLRWCYRSGITPTNVAEHLRDADSPLRTFRRTYGKVQAQNPGRWLTRSDAYDRLVAHSQECTLTGLRDELVLRLGLTGLRAAEIAGLTVSSVADLPAITWTGKGHKPRKATAGASLSEAICRYLDAYADPQPSDPLIVRQVLGSRRHGGPGRLHWHRPLRTRAVFDIVRNHAAAAGLGHVAPHDLRRTAAGILHTVTTDDGAHHFDLLDIQRVLGHADPATTMRSYLEPMDTDVIDRAAAFLD
jgi:integrase